MRETSLFNAIQRTEEKLFPGVLVPIALFEIPSGDNLALTLDRFPFYKSLPIEQRQAFGSPPANALVPVTVFPTARMAQRRDVR